MLSSSISSLVIVDLFIRSYVPKSGVRAISLLPSSLYYAVSCKAKHCLLGRKYASDTAAPFGSIFSYTSQDAQSLYIQGLVLSFGFCICGYSNNSCTLGSMSCFSYTTFRDTILFCRSAYCTYVTQAEITVFIVYISYKRAHAVTICEGVSLYRDIPLVINVIGTGIQNEQGDL